MPIKILVADDEPDLQMLISQKFRKRIRDNELIFAFAGNGVEALRKLQEEGETEVVLADINMPEMDGLTLLARLNEQHPLIKAVIVSAYGDMANIRTALNRGAFDFITKPVDFDDLEVTLDKTIRETRAQKQALKNRDHLTAIQRELDVARRIQNAMVPRVFPPFPQRKEFEIHAQMIPAAEVGGDFFDFFLIDDERLGFVIGDVSGKGVPAALFMAMSKTLLKATALTGIPPQECLQQVNEVLCWDNPTAMFVTIFYGILNTRTGEVAYCNGGHNPPRILRAGGRIEVSETTGGLVLGALAYAIHRSKTITLQPGEGLFLHTDGVTEAMAHDNQMFSDERLQQCLQRLHNTPLPEIVAGVTQEVQAFSHGVPQTDDVTILALRYLGEG